MAVEAEVLVTPGSQGYVDTPIFATSFNIPFYDTRVVSVALHTEVVYAANARDQSDQLQDLKRGEIGAKRNDVLIAS